MQYLAEVQKRSTFMGTKAELKLLACQRVDQTWTALASEETVQSEDANNYGAGALVLVDLNAQKQVQRVQDASRPLVSILQNFSRLQEKSRHKEEEIEQWNQSLTYQSQELSRREMEMEDLRQESEQLKADLEEQRQALEEQWSELRSRQSDLQHAALVLQEGQAQGLQALLEQVAKVFPEQLSQLQQGVAQKQAILNTHQQRLEAYQAEIVTLRGEVAQREQQFQQLRLTGQGDLAATLAFRQDQVRQLTASMQRLNEVYRQLYQRVFGHAEVEADQVDMEALEQLPLDQLRTRVEELNRDLDKVSQFVNDQEEELRYQLEAIEDLKAQVEQADAFGRLSLEADLNEEQQAYELLNKSLIDQRLTLANREMVFRQHQMVLARREGRSLEKSETSELATDLAPILSELDGLRKQQSSELQILNQQLAESEQQMRSGAGSSGAGANQADLMALERQLRQQQADLSGLEAKVSLYQEILQPLQEQVKLAQGQLDVIQQGLEQFQNDSPVAQQVNDLRETVAKVASQVGGT